MEFQFWVPIFGAWCPPNQADLVKGSLIKVVVNIMRNKLYYIGQS
jgi:hypothetical protein